MMESLRNLGNSSNIIGIPIAILVFSAISQAFAFSSITVLLSLFAAVLVISYAEAAGNCPLPSKVYGCSPKCVQDYECTHGKVCCGNSCNAKSCVEPAPYGGAGGHGGSNKNSHSSNGGVYCDNTKCQSGEVCKLDPKTKRNKCSRA